MKRQINKNLYDDKLPNKVIGPADNTEPGDENWFLADDYSIYKELEYAVNIEDSVIYIQGDIVLGTLFEVISKTRLILSQRTEENATDPITIVINSDGGDVYEALGIIDYFESLSVPVNIIARGRAMSAAAMILCSASGTRAASRNTTIMMHEASAEIYGKTADLKANADHIDALEESFYKMLANRSNQTEEFWIKACRKDFYMTAAKALEYGLIDQVI
jgi:ATP-dependent Clp protease protease subunit